MSRNVQCMYAKNLTFTTRLTFPEPEDQTWSRQINWWVFILRVIWTGRDKPCIHCNHDDVRDRHLLKETWMTWTWGMKVLIYNTGNDGELIKLGTIIFLLSESSVGNSVYTNRERVINEIPVCPRTRYWCPHGFDVYIAMMVRIHKRHKPSSFVDQVSFTSTLFLPPKLLTFPPFRF